MEKHSSTSGAVYLVRYANDRAELAWTLAVPAVGALYLLRRLPEVADSPSAVLELSLSGTTCNTVSRLTTTEHRSTRPGQRPIMPVSSRLYAHRSDTHQHDLRDYRQYEARVADILSSGPHVRAALLAGGIIWRLVMEVAERHPGTLELIRSYIDLGPSDEWNHHVAVLQDDEDNSFVDDALSGWEMDLICGVNKVYNEFSLRT